MNLSLTVQTAEDKEARAVYQLLIVDGDKEKREKLREMIENSTMKIEGIWECDSGIEAVKTALSQRPHICLTEIKLPDITGFEAVRQMQVVNPECKYIFTTAHSYFDYAVQAIQLGAVDVLLKPVRRDRLLSALRRATDQIREDQDQELENKKVRDLMYVLEKRILKELVTSQIDEETLWFFEAMDFDWPYFCICFVRIEREMSEDEQERISRRLRWELTASGYQHLLYAHGNSVDLMAFSQLKSYAEEVAENIKHIFVEVFQEFGLQIKFGAGSWESDFIQAEFSYLQAKGEVGESVSTVDEDGLRMKQIEKDMGKWQKKTGVPQEIQRICRYMEENYSEKITLNSIAEQAGFSKYYISRLFKQYMGVTIIDYLIKIRLDKAKKLLVSGEYNIKQISYMVGYSDPNYFTWSFKKYLGISPIKYKYFQEYGNA